MMTTKKMMKTLAQVLVRVCSAEQPFAQTQYQLQLPLQLVLAPSDGVLFVRVRSLLCPRCLRT